MSRNLEAPAPDIDGIAFLGQAPHRGQHHAGGSVEVGGRLDRDAEKLGEFVGRHAAGDQP